MTVQTRAAEVIIIGGGLHGSSAALHLARAGVRALVIEKNYVGRHASGVNAGGVRTLSRLVAQAYYDSRERLGFPMLPAADQPAATADGPRRHRAAAGRPRLPHG